MQLTQFLPAEYYIVHDCVESNRKEDFDRLADGSITYSSLENEPTYRICVEQAAHQGYSKLRCVDDYNQGGTRLAQSAFTVKDTCGMSCTVVRKALAQAGCKI